MTHRGKTINRIKTERNVVRDRIHSLAQNQKQNCLKRQNIFLKQNIPGRYTPRNVIYDGYKYFCTIVF